MPLCSIILAGWLQDGISVNFGHHMIYVIAHAMMSVLFIFCLIIVQSVHLLLKLSSLKRIIKVAFIINELTFSSYDIFLTKLNKFIIFFI